MFFCAERERAGEESLRALMLPDLPAKVLREVQGYPMAVKLARREIIRQDVLELHGR